MLQTAMQQLQRSGQKPVRRNDRFYSIDVMIQSIGSMQIEVSMTLPNLLAGRAGAAPAKLVAAPSRDSTLAAPATSSTSAAAVTSVFSRVNDDNVYGTVEV